MTPPSVQRARWLGSAATATTGRWLGRTVRNRLPRPSDDQVEGDVVAAVLAALAAGDVGDLAAPRAWRVLGRMDGRSGSSVLAVGPHTRPAGLLKLSARPWLVRRLEHQAAVLAALHADQRLGSWRALLPRVLSAGQVHGVTWVLETLLPGVEGTGYLADPGSRHRFVIEATAAVAELHRRTSSAVRVGDDELDRWVHGPVEMLRPLVTGRRERRVLDHVERLLVRALSDRPVQIGWTHGDFHPANVLTAPDGTTAGIVDWCAAEPSGLPALDVVTLRLFVEVSVRRLGLGTVVDCWLMRGGEPELARAVATSAPEADEIDACALVLLAWLRHAANFVDTEPPGVVSPFWLRRTVRPVLTGWVQSWQGGASR